MRSILYIMAGAGVLSACSITEPDVDYTRTGVDGSGQLHLSVNRVVPGMHAGTVLFTPGGAALDKTSAASLAAMLDDGIQAVRIISPDNDVQREGRDLTLTHFLRGRGIESTRIIRDTDAELPADTYRVEVMSMAITPPDCPNWSSSAATSYSNMPFSQMGCATASDIGAQIADPADLVKNDARIAPDTTRNSVVIQQYRANKDWSPSATGGGASASGTVFGGGGNSSTSVPQSASGGTAPQ